MMNFDPRNWIEDDEINRKLKFWRTYEKVLCEIAAFGGSEDILEEERSEWSSLRLFPLRKTIYDIVIDNFKVNHVHELTKNQIEETYEFAKKLNYNGHFCQTYQGFIKIVVMWQTEHNIHFPVLGLRDLCADPDITQSDFDRIGRIK